MYVYDGADQFHVQEFNTKRISHRLSEIYLPVVEICFVLITKVNLLSVVVFLNASWCPGFAHIA
jgi:hypothetical protein